MNPTVARNQVLSYLRKSYVVDVVQHWLRLFVCLTSSWDLRIGTCWKNVRSLPNLLKTSSNHLVMTQVAHWLASARKAFSDWKSFVCTLHASAVVAPVQT